MKPSLPFFLTFSFSDFLTSQWTFIGGYFLLRGETAPINFGAPITRPGLIVRAIRRKRSFREWKKKTNERSQENSIEAFPILLCFLSVSGEPSKQFPATRKRAVRMNALGDINQARRKENSKGIREIKEFVISPKTKKKDMFLARAKTLRNPRPTSLSSLFPPSYPHFWKWIVFPKPVLVRWLCCRQPLRDGARGLSPNYVRPFYPRASEGLGPFVTPILRLIGFIPLELLYGLSNAKCFRLMSLYLRFFSVIFAGGNGRVTFIVK